MKWFLVGLFCGLLLAPVAAQTAQRIFATQADGTIVPVLCVQSGTGCWLQVQGH